MKAIKIILGAFLGCVMFAFASGDQVPTKVKDAFAKKFPTAKKVKWDKEDLTEWEAEFKMNAVKYSANFLEDGTWKETEHKIDLKEVPQNVKSSLMTAFPGYNREEVELSETANGIFYEFEIQKAKSNMEVVIDSNGKIVNQGIQKDNDKE